MYNEPATIFWAILNVIVDYDDAFYEDIITHYKKTFADTRGSPKYRHEDGMESE